MPSAAVAAPADSAACNYRRCALAIAPVWNGLAVVRGEQEQRVARLGFFWPGGDVRPVFADTPQGAQFAERAIHVRRTAAVLTDLGIALAVSTAVAYAADSDHSTARGLALGSVIALGIGVPLQFKADGHLSRAVWWHNTQYGGPAPAP